MQPYVIVMTTPDTLDQTATRVGLPAAYIAGPGFTWTARGWATDLPVAALIQAPGSFLVRAR